MEHVRENLFLSLPLKMSSQKCAFLDSLVTLSAYKNKCPL